MNWKIFLILAIVYPCAEPLPLRENLERILQSQTLLADQEVFEPREMAKLINEIGEYWNMSSLFIIYKWKLSNNRLAQALLSELHQKNGYFEYLPHMTLRDVDVEKSLYEIADVDDNALVLTLMHSAYDRVLKATARATRSHRSCFTIYLLHTFTYDDDHRYIFEQLWKYQLRRPLLIANGRYLLTMDPYPVLQIVNVTSQPMTTWFPIANRITDFKGYTLNMPVQNDFPSTVFYLDAATQKYVADGFAAGVVTELMARLNVSVNVYPLNVNKSFALNYYEISQLLRKGEIELSPHLLSIVDFDPDEDYSYPFVSTSRCIMTPQPHRSGLTFVDFINWKLCLVLVIIIVIYEMVWHLYPLVFPNRSNRQQGWQRYRPYYVICILLSIPAPALPLPGLKRIHP